MKRIHRLAIWMLLGLAALCVAGTIAARLAFNAYLNSSAFQQTAEKAAARALDADTELMPMHIAGTTIYSDGLRSRGADSAFFQTLRADQIRADFNWHGLLSRVWQIDELSAQRLDLQMASHPPKRAISSATSASKPNEAVTSGWRLDLRKAVIRETNMTWDGGAISGAMLTITPRSPAWLLDVAGGHFAPTGWPEMQINSARLRYQPPMLFITDSSLQSGGGTAAINGEINFDAESNLQITLNELDVSPLLTPDWRARLSGKISGDVNVTASRSAASDESHVAKGSLRLTDGRLEALPILDQIATFTRTQRFRQLALTKASCNFTSINNGQKITARNIVMESEGLMRVEGDCVVTGEEMDGTFQVGITPASLQWLPGAQDHVFTVSRVGYLWTPVRLTGVLNHPNEDLTPRLAAAAGNSVIDKAQEAAGQLQDTTGKARDAASRVLDLLLH
jgi:hypothetical protein